MNNRWKIATLTLVSVLIVSFGVYFYLSPYLALREMQQGFVNKDAEAVIAHIDFPKFKENFKAELNAKMMSEMTKNADKNKNNPFAGLGLMMGPAIVNNIIDAYVSPAAIERMMKDTAAQQPQNAKQPPVDANPFKNGFMNEEKVSVQTGYKSFNEFTVDTTDKIDPAKGATLIFERRGIMHWQLVNMKIK